MSKAGEFHIHVSQGGYPVWCEISYCGKRLTQISHTELTDLRYAVEKAIREAKQALPEDRRLEIE